MPVRCSDAATTPSPRSTTPGRLLGALHGSNDCIFAVAYIDRPTLPGIRELFREVRGRSSRKSFRLRVLFRSVDVRTHPEAIAALMELERATGGRVSVRYGDDVFHAKAFAFKGKPPDRPRVAIGSANVTRKALSAPSGELGVWIGPSDTADEAWDTLEELFEAGGNPERGDWLVRYGRKFAKREAMEKRAAKIKMPADRQKAAGRRLDLDRTPFTSSPAKTSTQRKRRACREDGRPQSGEIRNSPAVRDTGGSTLWRKPRGSPPAASRSCSTFTRGRTADRESGYGASPSFGPESSSDSSIRSWARRTPWCGLSNAAEEPWRSHTGAGAAAIPAVLRRHGVGLAWLENQTERMPRPETRRKLAAIFRAGSVGPEVTAMNPSC